MTCRPDYCPRFVAITLAMLLALGAPLAAAPKDDAIAEAVAAIVRGDGVAAEVAGLRAIDQGAPRAEVAALIGEGELLQGDLADTRTWLAGMDFNAETRARGLHALARLELADGNLAGAAAAFDLRLAEGDPTALLWVDIGRMRYRAGEHALAIEAAEVAVDLEPDQPRALEFLAQLTRDSSGMRAALPLFRRALVSSPDDVGLIGQYAATLGDAGEHRQMLAAVRALLAQDDSAPFGYFLQAVLAARVGDDDLARRLWWRTKSQYDGTAVGLMIVGVLEYRSGNPAVAVEKFDDLRRMQPFNETALLMYARALVANGEANVAIAVLEAHAQRPDATPYMLVLMARAHEQLGERDRAGQYLDRAAVLARTVAAPLPAFLPRDGSGRIANPDNPVMQMRQMLAEGQASDARALVNGLLAQFPGSADLQVVAGDVELLAGNGAAAMAHYRAASLVRSDWPLVRRMVAALTAQGTPDQARAVLAEHLSQNPRQQAAAAMLGRMQRDLANPARATALLRQAAGLGGGTRDPLLLADLAEMEAVVGNTDRGVALASVAHDQHRGNRRVAQVFGRLRAMQGDAAAAQILLAKAAGTGIAPVEARPR